MFVDQNRSVDKMVLFGPIGVLALTMVLRAVGTKCLYLRVNTIASGSVRYSISIFFPPWPLPLAIE